VLNISVYLALDKSLIYAVFPVTLAMHAFIPNGVKENIRALTVEVAKNTKTRSCQDSQRLVKIRRQSD
jgi:hypothetical protein